MNRRGFLARLGGAILGATALKVIGPIEIAGPDPAVWKAAASLPVRPVHNTYIPLQQIAARAVEIVARETEWLRMHREAIEECLQSGWHVGDSVRIRERMGFTPYELGTLRPEDISELSRMVHLTECACVSLRFTHDEIPRAGYVACPSRDLDQFSRQYIEPAAYRLAEQVIQGVRRRGGGDFLVTGGQQVDYPDLLRVAQVTSEADGMTLRVMAVQNREGVEEVRLDMLYGVG
jgi:hypothetical protein